MLKIQCYGCHEYGHNKRDCHKLKKDNNKRRRVEAHITKEVEEPEKKKPKKVEVLFSIVKNSCHGRKHCKYDRMHHIRRFQLRKKRAHDIIIES